ncbi:MAG: AsmA family protein [Betaproteobacteria bacterium]
MRIFWRILIAIGGLLALLLVGVWIAVHTVDFKSLIGPIQARVKEATGRDLLVGGGVDLKLSLEPKVVIEDVSLANAPWGKAPQMITAQRVEAQVALLPLLRRDFQVKSFKLVDPVIALETDAKGVGNWQFANATPSATPGAPSAPAAIGGLFVGDLAIVNGILTFRDGENGKLTTLTITDFELNARDPQSAVSARFRGSVDDIAITLEGDLGPLASLAQRRWPYPVALKGQINGQQASVDTKIKVQDQTVTLDPLELGIGKSKVVGQMNVVSGKARPRLSFKLAATTLSLADLALPVKAGAVRPATAPVKSRYVFSDAPIDLGALRSVDADGELSADTLLLRDGRKLDHARLQFKLQDGVLDAPVVQAGIFGGTLAARIKIDATHDKDAALNLHVDARSLDLAAILAEAGIKRELRGGKTSVNADIAARGASLHQWADSANGSVLAVVGPASMGHPSAGGDAAFNKLADAVNPFRNVDSTTEIQCAVIRLPLSSGTSRIDRSIAIETNKIGANASGTLDFGTEMLDLSIKPQVRKGISLNIDQIASLVRFHGPFSAPVVGVDAKASAATVATLGAAVATGGASLLGQVLLKSATADGAAPCQIALGKAGARSDAPPATAAQPAPSNDLGKALGKLLGRQWTDR